MGEQPGDSEDIQGEPFVGPAGRLLDKALSDAGVDRESTYATNVVKHFKMEGWGPPFQASAHAKPNRTELNACRPWLDAEVERLDPAVVVCLGATAAQALLGSRFRVTRDHGQPIDFGTRWVVATLHPAAVLRSRGSDERQRQYEQLVTDLEVAAGLVG
ncbi:MAG: uracil-DNA glycosylase [Acidimicrobiia bacterium]